LELNESDFSPDAVTRRGDTVVVVAPFAPGEKQLTVQYLVPSSLTSLVIPMGQPGAKINVLAEEPKVAVSGKGIAFTDNQVLQGRSFRRWSGEAQPGSVIRVTLPGSPRNPRGLLVVLVGTMSLALGLAAWRLLGRPRGASGAPSAELLDTLAALDVRYAGREAETPPDEWKSYVEERARLKARVEATLAAGRKTS
jgi:hypothetical protein